MANLLLLTADIWALGGLVLLLHYLSPRFGFAPLLMLLGALTVFVQSQLRIYIEPVPGFIMFLSSNALVPVVVMSVLVLYVANGAVPARMIIFAIIGISLLVVLLQGVYRLHLSLPNGGTLSGLNMDSLVPPLNVRVTLGSLVAYLGDMFVIAVFYQGVKNLLPALADWIVVGLALLAGMWTDSILFTLFASRSADDIALFLPGDLIGKTVSAVILWPLTAFYMVYIAPKMPDHVGADNRRTFDLLFGAFSEVKMALVRTEAALAQSETERRKEEAYFHQISDNITEALWLSEPNQSHSLYVNPAYETLWGRSAASIYADPASFIDAIHPEDRERILGGLPTQVSGNYDVEYRVMRPDGTFRWVRDRAFPISNEQGEVYRIAGISEDITERKLMEKQDLELAVEREKVKLLRDFIGEASHDLRSPLTAINLKIYHLTKTQDESKRSAYLKELEALSTHMSKMIEDLFTLARLENIGDLQLVRLNVGTMAREVVTTLQPIIEQKQIELTLDLSDEEIPLYADTSDLARALANLVENAVNYTPEGGLLNIQAKLNNGELVIKVTDTGIGISEEDQARMFNRFYRAANARSVVAGGTGLGLAIVKRVVERHHGRIEVLSALGSGTTITIYLPKAS
jgi:PAS domain S-box-containing protein